MTEVRLPHLSESGDARMVDVSDKPATARSATAGARVRLSAECVAALRDQSVPKGDALAVARIAGIQAAKKTPDLIPLCHPLFISGVDVTAEVTDDGVEIRATVRTTERTGVEMEALTAVSVAGLAVIDMIKAIDRAAVITDVRVLAKSGGRRGGLGPGGGRVTDTALVISISTRAAAGVYADTSGPVIHEALAELGYDVSGPVVVPDGDEVGETLRAAVAAGHAVVITTGGTGLNPNDHTPEQTRAVVEREIPQLAAAIARYGVDHGVATAVLSRGVAGVAGQTLIINLPGSRGGARDGMAVLAPVLAHAVSQLRGGDH